MASSFGSQSAAERRAAQRRTARELEAGRSPLGGRYREIVRKATLRRKKDQAFKNFDDQLGEYLSYNKDTVREGVFKVMNPAQVEWTITADAEEIRDRASAQTGADASYVIVWNGHERNPWWYH